MPRLVQFLQSYDNTALVFEAAWALTNVSSGTSEHTRVVIDNGAIPIFVQLLRLTNNDVHELQEQAIWALGNIAGDSPRCLLAPHRQAAAPMGAGSAGTAAAADAHFLCGRRGVGGRVLGPVLPLRAA